MEGDRPHGPVPFLSDTRELAAPAVFASALTLAAFTAIALHQARKRPWLPVGWLWYAGTLVPVIGLVQVGLQSMADRYTYIPSIGLFILAAWAAEELAQRWHVPRAALAGAAGVLLLAAFAATWIQTGYWQDSIALFTRAVATSPGSSLAHNNLGVALAQDGRFD